MSKARPGRKRKAGKREPNGKLSRRTDDKQARRSIDEQSAMYVAKDARQRLFGLKEDDAGTDLAGSVVGRLFLAGDIGPEQLNAARLLSDTYASYQRVMDSPRPPKAVNIGGASGAEPPDTTPEQSVRAQAAWNSIKRVLSDANSVHRTSTLYAACDYIVLRDEDHPHLYRDCGLGLNAIAQAYGLLARAA